MPTIRIDDEVYAWLEGQATGFGETPNAVLRRIARLDEPTGQVDGPVARDEDLVKGKLLPLIQAGLLEAGATLIWTRPRKGQTHQATVTAGGCLKLADGQIFASPSPAAVALADEQTNGWAAWHYKGQSLNTLKKALPS